MDTLGAQARGGGGALWHRHRGAPRGYRRLPCSKEWRRSSRIVLEKNPDFREEYYEAEPPADDPVSQRLYREMKGKRIPQLDRVEIYVIEESQPRWLAFLNGELDWVNLPYEFKSMALPGGKPRALAREEGGQVHPRHRHRRHATCTGT